MRERMISLSLAALGVLASLFLADEARTQSSPINPIGKIISATGAVTIEHGDAVVVQAKLPASAAQAKVGDFVYQGDTVSTGADASVGITFSDGTAFNVASNARMVLNEFVYDPKGKSNSSFFSLTKGTFTFIAGKVAKTGDMKINTPVATMGIRGTTPRVEISEDGTVTFNTLVEDKKAIDKIIGTVPEASKKQRQGISVTPKPRPPANTVASPTETPK
jgi:hypothetical protein